MKYSFYTLRGNKKAGKNALETGKIFWKSLEGAATKNKSFEDTA